MYQNSWVFPEIQGNTPKSAHVAEAAALALAAIITSKLNIIAFLSDCQQLVYYINSLNPPDQRIKPFIQFFSNFSRDSFARLCKISINLNLLADGLARQALCRPLLQSFFLVALISMTLDILYSTSSII